MKIYLYGSIAWRHPLGIGQALEWAREFGWDGIDARGLSLDIPGDLDIRLQAFGYDMLSPRHLRPSARMDLRRRIQDMGLSLLGIYCSSPVNLPWELGVACREHFAEYLHLAADLGVPWVRSINNTTFSGTGNSMPPEEAYQRTVNGLRELSGLAQDLNVGILLENNENTVTSDAESLLRLRNDLGNACKVGITYDPVNAYFQGKDVDRGLMLLKGHIDVLHVKNVRRWSTTRWDYMPRGDVSYEWTSLAEGDIDWTALLTQACREGFQGPVVYEYVNPFKGIPLSYWNTLREPGEAARVEANFLRGILKS
jgi:sugar phosphate isomerase/epimerase